MSASSARDFAEMVAQFLEQRGMSRSCGRMLGHLMVCDPPSQTAADLCTNLGISKGAVSVGTQQLMLMGLVLKTNRPGQRAGQYEMLPWAFVQSALDPSPYRAMRELLDSGIEMMSGAPDETLHRLRIAREFYAVLEERLPTLSAEVRREVECRLARPLTEEGKR